MEYMQLGDLEKYLREPFPEAEVRDVLQQLLEGLLFMHDNRFAHRDLKPGVRLLLSATTISLFASGSCFRMSSSCMRGRAGGLKLQTSGSANG